MKKMFNAPIKDLTPCAVRGFGRAKVALNQGQRSRFKNDTWVGSVELAQTKAGNPLLLIAQAGTAYPDKVTTVEVRDGCVIMDTGRNFSDDYNDGFVTLAKQVVGDMEEHEDRQPKPLSPEKTERLLKVLSTVEKLVY